MPPNGRSGVVQVGWLTNTMPASMRLATRLPRAISLVKTDPPNPKSESLASATASSSLLTRNRSATGPKSSSLYAGLPGLMFARIVGSPSIELVDRHHVGEVQHVDLLQLGGGPVFGCHDVQGYIRDVHHRGVSLSDARGFHNDEIESGGPTGIDGRRDGGADFCCAT